MVDITSIFQFFSQYVFRRFAFGWIGALYSVKIFHTLLLRTLGVPQVANQRHKKFNNYSGVQVESVL